MKEYTEKNRALKKEKKALILKTAFDEFSRYGFHKTKMESIANNAGISKGLIYNYFNNKEDLFKAVFFETAGVFSEMFNTLLSSSTSPKKKLKLFIEYTLDNYMEFLKTIILLLKIIDNEDMVEQFKPEFKNMYSIMLKQLALIFKEMGFNDPKTEAAILFGIFDGLTAQVIFETLNEKGIIKIKNNLFVRYSLK